MFHVLLKFYTIMVYVMILIFQLLLLVLLNILFQKCLLHPLQRLSSRHPSNLNFTEIHPALFLCHLALNIPNTTRQKENKTNF